MKMNRIILCWSILALILLAQADKVWSEPTINLSVKTILASKEPGPTDPNLERLTGEFQSVLKHASYRLLSKDNLTLNQRKSGRISLPGNRSMRITSKGISGNRVTLQVEIFKDNKQTFQTVVRLLNDSEVTVGGPKHKDGDLLFNIFASF